MIKLARAEPRPAHTWMAGGLIHCGMLMFDCRLQIWNNLFQQHQLSNAAFYCSRTTTVLQERFAKFVSWPKL